MFCYEALCYNCKKVFKVYEGSPKYKLVKEKRQSIFVVKIVIIKYVWKQ